MPEYTPSRQRTQIPISESTVFDSLIIECRDPLTIGNLTLYRTEADGTRVATAYLHGRYVGYHQAYPVSDPEVAEIRRRIIANTCTVYYDFESGDVRTVDELDHYHWSYLVAHPFQVKRRWEFINELIYGCDYIPGTSRDLPRFRFPGIVEGATRTYYKRQDAASAPDVRAVSELDGEGWTLTPPYGPYHLHSVLVTETPSGAPIVESPRRAYLRRADEDAAIRAVARAFHEYWSGLTSGEQGINVRMTLRDHVTHSIGRIWAAKPLDDDVQYFKAGSSSQSTRDARDAADWYLGNLEQWAFDRGFPALALALNQTGNRAVLADLLGDHVFCHVNEDGTVGDQLANPGEGIDPSLWNAWGDTHYNAALGTIVKAIAGSDAVVRSGGTYTLAGTSQITNPSGTTVYGWEKVSGNGGSLSADNIAGPVLSAPALTAGADPVTLVYRLTATNNGESDTDDVTIRVASPVLFPAIPNIPVVVGYTATHQLEVTGGIGPYVYAMVEGADWITINTDGSVSIAPPANVPPLTYTATYSVTDASGVVSRSSIQVTVSAS